MSKPKKPKKSNKKTSPIKERTSRKTKPDKELLDKLKKTEELSQETVDILEEVKESLPTITKAAGGALKPIKDPQYNMTQDEEFILKVEQLTVQGFLEPNEIAKQLKCSRHTVERILSRVKQRAAIRGGHIGIEEARGNSLATFARNKQQMNLVISKQWAIINHWEKDAKDKKSKYCNMASYKINTAFRIINQCTETINRTEKEICGLWGLNTNQINNFINTVNNQQNTTVNNNWSVDPETQKKFEEMEDDIMEVLYNNSEEFMAEVVNG